MEIQNRKCTYIMENKDKYTVSREDGKWVLHIFDKDHPNGKFLTRNKDIDKIYERIPEGMV
jgi:hypothetical protein